ncbi:Periplasmic serine endoprotease DegP [Candidatus Entotheonellaceae bacterium PAL068K]
MMHRFKRYRDHARFGKATLATLTLSFFLMGMVVASAFNLPPTPAAQEEDRPTAPVTRLLGASPRSFSHLAEKLSPYVVNVKVTKTEKIRGFTWHQEPEGPFGEFFKRFFKEMPRFPKGFKQHGSGSGVIIDAKGYILTNDHVIDGAREIVVTLADQQEVSAEIIGRDAKTDLAVLQINAGRSLPQAPLGDSDALKVGDWVLAIGNPYGLNHTVTSGIVSAKGRVIGAGPYDDFIQTDASINPGNSGGPLFNMRGEVVGINTAILPYGRGIGFAIPVNTARPLIPQLVASGKVTRGYLGVSIQSLTPALTKALNLQDRKGALVADVVPNGPAAEAGLQRGDVIVRLDQMTVDSAQELPTMVANQTVGEKVSITVVRQGKEHNLSLTIGTYPSETAEPQDLASAKHGKWGLQLRNLTPELAQRHGLEVEQGVLVVGVQAESPAARAGIRRGDVLLEVNQQPVISVQEVKEVIAEADDNDALLALVRRGEGRLYVAMTR